MITDNSNSCKCKPKFTFTSLIAGCFCDSNLGRVINHSKDCVCDITESLIEDNTSGLCVCNLGYTKDVNGYC